MQVEVEVDVEIEVARIEKMACAKDNLDTLSDDIYLTPEEEESPKKKKKAHLKSMGGKGALGKDLLTKYARQTFNHYRLGAISAAASEYGDGGFTLLKPTCLPTCPSSAENLPLPV